jgi:hemin uptake protein HemP
VVLKTDSKSQSNNGAGSTLTEPPTRISSESLLGPRGELLIVHNGREYRLRLTQNGKLILTA